MKLKLALIAALAGSLALPIATAAPADARTVVLRPSGPVAAPQWHGGWNRGGWNRPYHGAYYPRRSHGWGPALGGFAAGAIIGGALAAQAAPPPYYAAPAPAYDDDVAYCMQRFKSYDPASGTYLGYDGLRHPCP
jgi:hypothetical protein